MKVQECQIQIQDLFLERFREQLTPEGIDIFNRVLHERREFNQYVENNFTGRGRHNTFNFSRFTKIGDLFKRIYNGEIMIPDAEREREALDYEYERLERYRW